MRGIWPGVVAAVVAAVLLVGPVANAGPATATRGLTLVEDVVVSQDGRLHELTLHSPALGRHAKVRILLPAGYGDATDAETRYPTLLLLHGSGGDQRDWTVATDIEAHTADLGLVVVMPEGGRLGFYTDWLDGPAWETFHLRELLPWVDATYRTVGTRAGRAIAGLSMGGFGSTVYAARHPDLFAATAAFSGAVDIADAGLAEEAALKALGFADDRRWGPYLTHEANWRGHNPPDLAPNLRGMAIRLTAGTGIPCPGDVGPDHTEAGVATMAVGFTLALQRAVVPYDLELRPCGTHQWHYWEHDLRTWLPTIMGLFAAPPAAPASFDHRTTDARTDVWGWSFTAHRPAIEFLDLRAVSPAGLRATGSGLVDVVTAPAYEPGAAYALAASTAGAVTVPVAAAPALGTLPASPAPAGAAVADAEGRLHFRLDLGPAHTANQYSAEGIAAELLAAGSYFRTVTVSITRTAAAPDPSPPAAPPPSADGHRTIPATGAPGPRWMVVAAAVGAAVLLRRVATAAT